MPAKGTTIRQTLTIKATPHEVFEALMDARKHSRMTGSTASISRRVGGRVSAYDGYATGVNLELVRDRRIVQTWRADNWPKDHYSTVTFALSRAPGGTRLAFTQAGVPEWDHDAVKRGWVEFYWTPLRKSLER